MARSKNKGLSLIEVLISVLIFSILVIPIVSQLVSTMKNSKNAKQQQTTIEYAQSSMEYFKEAPLDEIATDGDYTVGSVKTYIIDDKNDIQAPDSSDYNVVKNNYTIDGDGKKVYTYADFKKAQEYKCGGMYEKVATGKAVVIEREYEIDDMKLGVKSEHYDCVVTLSTRNYALASLGKTIDDEGKVAELNAGQSKIDPNALNLGNVASIDDSRDAVITNINNFDRTAADSYFSMKSNLLKEHYPAAWESMISGKVDYNMFNKDSVVKHTTIKVTKDDKKYLVQAVIDYKEISAYVSLNTYLTNLEYTAYSKEFEELPDIFFMYNQCVYNGGYFNDYITLDISDEVLKEVNDGVVSHNVKLYLIGTQSDDSSVVNSIEAVRAGVLYDKYSDDIEEAAKVFLDLQSKYNDASEKLTEKTQIYLNIYASISVGETTYTSEQLDAADMDRRAAQDIVDEIWMDLVAAKDIHNELCEKANNYTIINVSDLTKNTTAEGAVTEKWRSKTYLGNRVDDFTGIDVYTNIDDIKDNLYNAAGEKKVDTHFAQVNSFIVGSKTYYQDTTNTWIKGLSEDKNYTTDGRVYDIDVNLYQLDDDGNRTNTKTTYTGTRGE